MANKYPKDSVGHSMTANVPTFSYKLGIAEIRKSLEANARDFVTIDYAYFLDDFQRLKGVLSIRDILIADPNVAAVDIMRRDVIKVGAWTDQERAAYLAVDNRLKALPVVDKKEKFLGVITSDGIREILDNEMVEDIFKSAGLHGRGKPGALNTFFNVKQRLPWLVIGLCGGFVAANIIKKFESALEAELLLAAFIPTIVYIADAVGTQSEAVFLHYLAVEKKSNPFAYMFTELKTSIIISFALSFLIMVIGLILHPGTNLYLVLGVSLFATVIVANAIGVLLPLLFSKLKLDPAAASGPLATIVTDIFSLIIYLGVASIFI